MTEEIPERWRPLMERKGIKVSYRGLSERADVSHEAVRRVIRGWSVKPGTIQKVADALGVDREVVNDLRGDQPTLDAWAPPQFSSLLSHEERDALSRLISLMVAGRTHDGRDAAPKSQAAWSAADQSHFDPEFSDEDRDRMARDLHPVLNATSRPAAVGEQRSAYGLAARAGEAAHGPDMNTGEESQDLGGDESA